MFLFLPTFMNVKDKYYKQIKFLYHGFYDLYDSGIFKHDLNVFLLYQAVCRLSVHLSIYGHA